MNLKNTGKIVFLCLAALLARDCLAYVYTLRINNTSGFTIIYGFRSSIMIDGFPDVPGAMGTIPPYSYVLIKSSDFGSNERLAWTASWIMNGVAVLHRTGFAINCDFSRVEYWGFDAGGNPFAINSVDLPPVPDPPVIYVPSGWPFGDDPTGGDTIPYVSSSLDGEYKFDPVTGTWVWHSNWTDPLYVPPFSESGDGWTFGIRPGGPVMASGPNMPEWYLVPSITPPGATLEGSTNDVSQMALNNEYWLREIYRQDAKRNAMLSDLRQYVGALELDVTVAAPVVNVEVPDVNVTVDAPVVNVEVPDVNVNVTGEVEFPERFTVDTDLALEQYVYDGLNPADSAYWPDDDDMSQAWHRPYTADTSIVESLNSGADGVAANWTLDGGAFGEGGGWFESWIGGMYRNLVVVVNRLKFGLTAFSDVGKSYTLVVPFRGSSITLDWSSYQSVMSAFRAFVVFVLWVVGVKDIRDSVAMIFGGH